MEPVHLRASLSMEDYQNMLAAIEASAKCPVCLERVRSPATLCNNGHAICRQCRQMQQCCPTCRAPFSRINPVFLNALMDLLPAQCRNSSRGCDLVLNSESLTRHERECQYRVERCRVRGCSWSDEISLLLDHVTSRHPEAILPASDTTRVPDFIVSDDDYSASLISTHNSLIWLHVTNNFYKKQIPVVAQWVQRSLTLPEGTKCSCDVTVVKDHFQFFYSQPVLPLVPLEQTLASTLSKQFLITPNSIFPNFVSPKYDIEIRFGIKFDCEDTNKLE